VAAITGLSAGAVRVVRHQLGPESAGLAGRVGRDGRVRRLDTAEGRLAARDSLARRPEAPLREVARLVGIAPATVRDVRERMRRGDDPIPAGGRTARDAPSAEPVPAVSRDRVLRHPAVREPSVLLRNLSQDPSLRLRERGRSLLRWLMLRANGTEGWDEVAASVPPHCLYLMAEVARGCAEQWATLADELQRDLRSTA
jgi:hypothetical protein